MCVIRVVLEKKDGQQENLNVAFGSLSARTGRSIDQKSYALNGCFRPEACLASVGNRRKDSRPFRLAPGSDKAMKFPVLQIPLAAQNVTRVQISALAT